MYQKEVHLMAQGNILSLFCNDICNIFRNSPCYTRQMLPVGYAVALADTDELHCLFITQRERNKQLYIETVKNPTSTIAQWRPLLFVNFAPPSLTRYQAGRQTWTRLSEVHAGSMAHIWVKEEKKTAWKKNIFKLRQGQLIWQLFAEPWGALR